MKIKYAFSIGLMLAALSLAGGKGFAQIQTFGWQGVQRQYLVKTPAQQENAVPVLFFLHGLGDNITRLDNEFHFQQIANELGWAIVVPQALNEGIGNMWNAGMMNSSTDDSGFLMALLDMLAEPKQLNLDSVFFTGFSMGGFMSHRMAIEHGDRIAGCAPVSGLITHYMATQTPVAPVRMLHIHGTSDPVVGYNGGSQYFGSNLGLSVEAILDYWQNANGCSGEPEIDTLPDLQNDGLRFVRYTYKCDTELQHIKVIGGVHDFYHDNFHDINYITEIYNFFKSKGGYDNVANPDVPRPSIWPNPTTGTLNVKLTEAGWVELIDPQGRVVLRQHFDAGMAQLDFSAFPEGLYLLKTSDGVINKLVLSR